MKYISIVKKNIVSFRLVLLTCLCRLLYPPCCFVVTGSIACLPKHSSCEEPAVRKTSYEHIIRLAASCQHLRSIREVGKRGSWSPYFLRLLDCLANSWLHKVWVHVWLWWPVAKQVLHLPVFFLPFSSRYVHICSVGCCCVALQRNAKRSLSR